jgi:hypothetical protein
MVSFTCHSNADPATGGNFYISKYGILVEQASNTCVARLTKDEHGTTMADPVEGRHNYGIRFDISRRLKEAKANSARKEANKALGVEKVMNKKTNKETRKTKRKKMKKGMKNK